MVEREKCSDMSLTCPKCGKVFKPYFYTPAGVGWSGRRFDEHTKCCNGIRTGDCSPASTELSRVFSSTVEDLLNKGWSIELVVKSMHEVMSEYEAEYGLTQKED